MTKFHLSGPFLLTYLGCQACGAVVAACVGFTEMLTIDAWMGAAFASPVGWWLGVRLDQRHSDACDRAPSGSLVLLGAFTVLLVLAGLLQVGNALKRRRILRQLRAPPNLDVTAMTVAETLPGGPTYHVTDQPLIRRVVRALSQCKPNLMPGHPVVREYRLELVFDGERMRLRCVRSEGYEHGLQIHSNFKDRGRPSVYIYVPGLDPLLQRALSKGTPHAAWPGRP